MTGSHDTSVIIAGGGPVGLILATELGARGIDVIVLESTDEVRDEPRAGMLHARTVQSLTRRGYVHTPSHTTEEPVRTGFHFGGKSMLTLVSPGAEGAPNLNIPQADLERGFLKLAVRQGVDVRRGHRVLDVAQNDARVVATVHNGSGRYRVTADHLVGADGARSTVRERVEITSTANPPTFSGVLGQVRLHDPAAVPNGWTHTRQGWTLINLNPHGHSRVLTHEFTEPLPRHRDPVDLAEFQRTVSRILGHDVPMSDPRFLSRFSDYSRVADRYVHGRIALAGDAAHVHAPLGGQGLNLGIQDAFNLAWKLALVASGTTPLSLLQTYHDERRPIAEAVVANTRAQAALMRPGEEFDPLRELVQQLLGIDEANDLVQGVISGQRTHYPPDASAGTHAGRFLPNLALHGPSGPTSVAELLTPGRGVLLISAGSRTEFADTARFWKDRVDTHFVVPRDEVDWYALLLRPDGYVAWSADRDEPAPPPLDKHLNRWFGPGMGALSETPETSR